MSDPRNAKTLGEAAQNPDGTYNLAKAMSWLSSVMSPNASLSEDDVKKIIDEVKAKKERRP